MKGKLKKPKSKSSRSKKSKSINFGPVLTLSIIALLLIGFIYWSEHAAVPVKQAVRPVKQEVVPVKKEVAPVKRESVPVKHAAAPVKVASVVPAKPIVTEKPAVRPSIVEMITEKIWVKAEKKELAGRKRMPLTLPAATVRKRAMVAIVIDDFGYNMNNVDAFFDMKMPITLAVLPQQRYSREIAERARSRGHEVILHLPMESWRPEAKEEADTIRAGMSDAEIVAGLKKEIADIPGLSGVSNHQGSKATEDRDVMTDVMRYLKKNDLYFFDSFTTAKSVGREVASETGARFARRNKFLDNDNDEASIEKQLAELKTMALARGRAIAIGHDRKTTVAVLAKVMPEMEKEGIEFVYLSEMVK